jgi:hypothetical protein
VQSLKTIQELIEELVTETLAKLHIETWDTLMFGDGSGCGWNIGIGWACILIDRHAMQAKPFWGGCNAGTVTLAELFPYLHALSWYTDKKGPGHRRRKELVQQAGRCMEIHIITDSRVTAQNGMNQNSRKSHIGWWAALDTYRAQGYNITFHHMTRNSTNLNILADALSKQSRKVIEGCWDSAVTALQKEYPGVPSDVTVYDFFRQ